MTCQWLHNDITCPKKTSWESAPLSCRKKPNIVLRASTSLVVDGTHLHSVTLDPLHRPVLRAMSITAIGWRAASFIAWYHNDCGVDKGDKTVYGGQPRSQQAQLHCTDVQRDENANDDVPNAHGVPLEGEQANVCERPSGRLKWVHKGFEREVGCTQRVARVHGWPELV